MGGTSSPTKYTGLPPRGILELLNFQFYRFFTYCSESCLLFCLGAYFLISSGFLGISLVFISFILSVCSFVSSGLFLFLKYFVSFFFWILNGVGVSFLLVLLDGVLFLVCCGVWCFFADIFMSLMVISFLVRFLGFNCMVKIMQDKTRNICSLVHYPLYYGWALLLYKIHEDRPYMLLLSCDLLQVTLWPRDRTNIRMDYS